MQTAAKVQKTCLGMSTVISHTAYGGRAERAVEAAQKETRRLEGLLSRFLPESDIARLNRAAGHGSVRLSREAFEALSIGLACSQNTDGVFRYDRPARWCGCGTKAALPLRGRRSARRWN